MTKVIIIEGPDNCGKDSLIKRLKSYFNDQVCVMHASIPSEKDLFKFYYNGLIHDTLDLYFKHSLNAVIHNRSIYGEYVYGPKYRDISKAEAAKLIYNLEIGQLKTFITGSDLYFITLNSTNVDLLVKNDDGLSISNKHEDIQDEINSFNEIYNLSSIKHKKLIYVNNGSEFRSKESIFNEVINFLNTV